MRYGYAMIALGTFVEGETVLLLAGILAHEGLLSPWGVGIASLAGAMLGDQCYFYIGRRYGSTLKSHFPRIDAAIERLSRRLLAHETFFLVSFRFIWGIRTIAPVFFGARGVSSARFLLYNALGTVLWAGVFTVAGYAAGDMLEGLLGEMHTGHHLLIAALMLVALATGAATLFWKIRGSRGKSAKK